MLSFAGPENNGSQKTLAENDGTNGNAGILQIL